jgi:hypothetical protein
VKRRDLTDQACLDGRAQINPSVSRVVPCQTSVWLGVLVQRTFELKLKVNELFSRLSSRIDTSSFTESLILAQDERWRRA